MKISLVHIDRGCIVVDKPSGLPAVPGRTEALQDCVISRLRRDWPDALVVHRLDMHTSGLMLFARGIDVQRRLCRAFAERQVHKRYIALVHGTLADDSGSVDLAIAADWPNRPRRVIDHVGGQASITHWRVLSRGADSTRVELEPITGRTHQLRVHLAAIGHPILGDALYAAPAVQGAAPRLMLHAAALSLVHPLSAEPIRFVSEAPF